MNKKRSVIVLFVIFAILAVSFVSAADNITTSATGFEKSYQCLKDSIDEKPNKYADMTVEELALSLLALGYDSTRQSAIKTELDSKKDTTNSCWPSGACTLKETAMVLLAYSKIKQDVSSIQSWLLNQTGYSSEMSWYLQIDNPSSNSTKCTLTYDDNSTKSITINSDKTITGSPGTCFSTAPNWWLLISNNCLGKEFQVKCDNDFIVSYYFKRTSSMTAYISDQTEVGAPDGKVKTKIESYCFKQSGSCNFEGSLWATAALYQSYADKNEIKKFIPYLITLSTDTSNKRYFPSAFLFMFLGYDEYYSDMVNSQNTNGYWQLTDSSKRYYDTAAGLWVLYGKGKEQFDKGTEYLLSPDVQGNGCWGSLRDTAFLLFAAYPKPAYSGGTTITRCSDYSNQGYSCAGSEDICTDDLNGTVLPNFFCSNGVCCSEKSTQTCSDRAGTICKSSEECSGDYLDVDDSSTCCDGECTEEIITPDTTACEDESSDYSCKAQCGDNEESQPFDCGTSSKECCSPLTELPPTGKSYWWVWVLVILILLLVLGIIFRDKVREYWYRATGKFGKAPVSQQQRPGMPPTGVPPQRPMVRLPMRPMPRGMFPPNYAQQRPIMPRPNPRPFPKDKELDETLNKLKGMSKK